MRRYITVFVAIMTIFGANAQNFIRGRVVEANNSAAIGYATIALLSDSTIIRAVAAREDGYFSIELSKKGPLKVEVSAVGYTTTIKDIVGKGENIDLGDIALSQGVAVDAVNITIQRPIVTADAEKLTYSVEDDPEAATSTLEDMIRKVPQLSLDAEGKVLMNGQSDYKILINGRNSSSISRNFADVIKSMPAASIKRIEVITNPSMKYDAEGTGGVLNIITAKSRFDGYNGRVSLMASNWFNRNFSTNNSAMATLQHNKFSVSASFYYSQAWATDDNVGNQYTKIENLVSGNPSPLTITDIDYGYRYYSIYGNLNASYQINDRNFVTAEFGIWDGSNKTFMKEQYSYFDAMHNPLFSQRVEQNIHYPSWLGIDATVSYEHSFKKEGHSLTISDNASFSLPTASHNNQYIYALQSSTSTGSIYSSERTLTRDNVLQIDYRNPLAKSHFIEAGVKHSYSYSQSDNLRTSFDADGNPTSNADGSTQLTKHIAGLYAGYSYTAQKFSLRAGGRLEGAWYAIDYKSGSKSDNFTTSLLNVVPYLSATYTPKVGHTLSVAYTERLSRPGIHSMSPFMDEATILSRKYGNPNLKSGISHSIELKYAYVANKWSAMASFQSMLSNNLVSQYTFTDDEGYLNQTYANHGHVRGYKLQATFSYRPSAKFNLSATIVGGYTKFSMPQEGILNSGWAMMQNLSATIALWKGARVTLTEYASLPSPSMNMKYDRWIVTTSVRLGQSLLKDKMEIALLIHNPHQKYGIYESSTQAPTHNLWQCNTQIARSIRLSISYNFGNHRVRVRQANRKVYNDENIGSSQQGANTGMK